TSRLVTFRLLPYSKSVKLICFSISFTSLPYFTAISQKIKSVFTRGEANAFTNEEVIRKDFLFSTAPPKEGAKKRRRLPAPAGAGTNSNEFFYRLRRGKNTAQPQVCPQGARSRLPSLKFWSPAQRVQNFLIRRGRARSRLHPPIFEAQRSGFKNS
ncbi:MAG TPA: hypothetical protein H9844_04650, partial [Candidatus Evtepia faecigallinarum]|nr:hypothetical protein [Candidatus Evtepia faecigallinarum]